MNDAIDWRRRAVGGRTMTMDAASASCRSCGCTEADCSRCVERTGTPCSWAEPGLCSACVEPSTLLVWRPPDDSPLCSVILDATGPVLDAVEVWGQDLANIPALGERLVGVLATAGRGRGLWCLQGRVATADGHLKGNPLWTTAGVWTTEVGHLPGPQQGLTQYERILANRCSQDGGTHVDKEIVLSWSDRELVTCMTPGHLAQAVVSVALDHGYDRGDLSSLSRHHAVAPMVERARIHMDGRWPDWRDRTINVSDEERAAFVKAVEWDV